MANQTHLEILKEGYEAWTAWRKANYSVKPDLSGADLREIKYPSPVRMITALISETHTSHGIDFSRTNLSGADLSRSVLLGADFGNADLSKADLHSANVRFSNFRNANLSEANLRKAVIDESNCKNANFDRAILVDAGLSGCELWKATFEGADLEGADLQRSRLIETNFKGANITGCHIYGLSAWDLKLDNSTQTNLIISPEGTSAITVDNLEVGQFIYLILNNKRIRDVINTITSKAVLILGRFTPERKAVLDALREELRKYDYLPILFDFENPTGKTLTDTVATLAHMSRFVIADLTDAKSIPQELQRIVPSLPLLPVKPIILSTEYEYGMFKDLYAYPWVLTPYRYDSNDSLITSLEEKVIMPAVNKSKELEERYRGLQA